MPPVVQVPALTVLGLIRARRGESGARALLDEARGVFEPGGWRLLVSAALAEAAWLDGDHARAGAEIGRGLDAATVHTDPWVAGELVRWAWIVGAGRPSVRAAVPFARELAGDWSTAASAWDDSGCDYDAALARLVGDVPALVQALRTFERLGARPAAAIARARLRARGAHPGTRGPRATTRANPHGLTTRQLQILELVREGLTCPQIATRLHISPKTANHHLWTKEHRFRAGPCHDAW